MKLIILQLSVRVKFPLPSYQIKSLLQIEFQKVPQLRISGKAGLMVGHLPI